MKIKQALRIDVISSNLPDVYIYLYIYNIKELGVGIYKLEERGSYINFPSRSFMKMHVGGNVSTFGFYNSYNGSGIIEMTLVDVENEIYSGTFTVNLLHENGSDSIEIKEGRFDLDLKTLNK